MGSSHHGYTLGARYGSEGESNRRPLRNSPHEKTLVQMRRRNSNIRLWRQNIDGLGPSAVIYLTRLKISHHGVLFVSDSIMRKGCIKGKAHPSSPQPRHKRIT